MKIYTKTGDKGDTGLYGGDRIGKDSARINAYGTVDECNALIGIVRTFDIDRELDEMLDHIQHQLFIVGSDLATPGERSAVIRIDRDEVKRLEKWIDRWQESLPPLKQFVLPGGCRESAFLHQARTVCRRAERWAVSLLRDEPAAAQAAIYLNRLSDFLFVAARTANRQVGVPDRIWKSPKGNRGK
jgi:cob(I)alamin adenosyltransferase